MVRVHVNRKNVYRTESDWHKTDERIENDIERFTESVKIEKAKDKTQGW